MTVRSRIAMLAAEFLGTAVLATVAINVSRSQIGIGYFVAIGVGLALGLLVLVLGPVSGGHFNPAVTLGLWTARKVKTLQAAAYVVAQLLGGVAAWQLANYFFGAELPSIANKSHDWKILIVEAVGTAVFTFVVAAAVFQKLEGGKAAAAIGGGLFAGVVVASLAANGVLNPAVAIANQSVSWAYMVGPLVGALLGVNLYVLLFAPVGSLSLPSPAKTASVVTPAPAARVVATKKPAARKPAAKKPAARKKR